MALSIMALSYIIECGGDLSGHFLTRFKMNTHANTHTYTHTDIYTHARTHTYTHTHVRTHARTHTYINGKLAFSLFAN